MRIHLGASLSGALIFVVRLIYIRGGWVAKEGESIQKRFSPAAMLF